MSQREPVCIHATGATVVGLPRPLPAGCFLISISRGLPHTKGRLQHLRQQLAGHNTRGLSVPNNFAEIESGPAGERRGRRAFLCGSHQAKKERKATMSCLCMSVESKDQNSTEERTSEHVHTDEAYTRAQRALYETSSFMAYSILPMWKLERFQPFHPWTVKPPSIQYYLFFPQLLGILNGVKPKIFQEIT